MKKLRLVLLVVCVIVFVYSSYELIKYYYEGYKNNQSYNEIKEVYDFDRILELIDGNTDEETLDDILEIRQNNFRALKEVNEDAVGWIYVPNTTVDYPVVQGRDNSYYLTNNVEKTYARAGAIFMDYRNTLSENYEPLDSNTIIYGHHMKNGSMFTSLKNFKKEDFFEANRYFYLDTPVGTKKYEIFAVIVTKADYNYIQPTFNSGEEFLKFVKELKDRALFTKDIGISEKDKIVTLSTCTYEYEDARLAVLGKLITNE